MPFSELKYQATENLGGVCAAKFLLRFLLRLIKRQIFSYQFIFNCGSSARPSQDPHPQR